MQTHSPDRRRAAFCPQAGKSLAGQVIQDPLDHAQRHSGFASFRWRGKSQSLHCLRWRVFDTRDDLNRSSALRAGFDINLENPLEALRPLHRRALLGWCAVFGLGGLCGLRTPAPAGRCDPGPMGAVSAAADIFDENGEYERTDFLYIGDTIEFFMQALDIDQPELLFLIEYMTPRELTENFALERTYYIPGQDYVDPDLPADFDAAVQPMQFLLEGARAGVGGDPDVFEQAGPWDLGFEWQDLLEFIFKSRFQAPMPDLTQATNNSLARPGPERAGE